MFISDHCSGFSLLIRRLLANSRRILSISHLLSTSGAIRSRNCCSTKSCDFFQQHLKNINKISNSTLSFNHSFLSFLTVNYIPLFLKQEETFLQPCFRSTLSCDLVVQRTRVGQSLFILKKLRAD